MHSRLTRWRAIAVAVVTAAAGLAAVPASPARAQPSCISVTFSATTWATGPDTGGFAINFTLTNECLNTTISGWMLQLTFAPDHELQQGWSANWTVSGSDVTATGSGWNSVLHPGQSTSIGFIGSYSGTYQDPLGCTINGLPCHGDNQPPDVALTSPADGGVYLGPCPVQLAADAVDPDGQIQLVEFYVNDELVGSDDKAPYELEISPNHPALVEPAGPDSNTAYARAYDDHDPPQSGSSPVVTFRQGPPPPPGLMIISCSFGVELEPGGSAVVGFLGGGCGVTEAFDVDVLVTGDPGVTADPSSFTFGPGAWRQDVTISAAPDAAGATATVRVRADQCAGATVPVTVVGGPGVNQPPEVTLTSPQDGDVFPSPCPVRLAADAADPDGEVTRVDFYVNGRQVVSDERAPYEIVIPGNHWSLASEGQGNVVFAEAFDDGDPALSAASESATFFQAVPPPALMIIACNRPDTLAPGESHVVHFVGVCGGPVEVAVTVTGDPGITAEPTSFTLGSSGHDVTISAAPDTAGATATVTADSVDGMCLPAAVQVTVSG